MKDTSLVLALLIVTGLGIPLAYATGYLGALDDANRECIAGMADPYPAYLGSVAVRCMDLVHDQHGHGGLSKTWKPHP